MKKNLNKRRISTEIFLNGFSRLTAITFSVKNYGKLETFDKNFPFSNFVIDVQYDFCTKKQSIRLTRHTLNPPLLFEKVLTG